MRIKYRLCNIVLLLSLFSLNTGCSNTDKQRVIYLNRTEKIEDYYVLIINDSENEKFSITYTNVDNGSGSKAYFDFEIYVNGEEKWSTSNSNNDLNIEVIYDEDAINVNNTYEVCEDTTIYIAYSSVSESYKYLLKNFSINNNVNDDYCCIYVNNYHLICE